MRKTIHAAAAVAAVATTTALVLTGCTGTGSTPAPSGSAGSGESTKSSINMWMYQQPVGNFNPIAPASGPDQEVESLIFDTPLVENPARKLEPSELTSMPKYSNGAQTVTMTLKKGLTWSDGQPVTSKDLAFTYTRAIMASTSSALLEIQGAADYAGGKATTVSGLTTPDDLTLKIDLTVADTGFASIAGTIGTLPAHALESIPDSKTFFQDAWFHAPAVSSGPYKFVSYQPNQYVQVEANPKFRSPAKIKTIYLKPLDATNATQQLSTGEMDIVNIPAASEATVKAMSGVTVDTVEGSGFVRAAFNFNKDTFKNVKVRQGLLTAVDRAGIVKSALGGQGIVPNGILGTIWTKGVKLNEYKYDAKKAKQLLQDGGFDFSKPISLMYIPGTPDRDLAVQVMQQQFKAVGVTLELNPQQGTGITAGLQSKNWDLFLYGGGNYTTVPSNIGPITNCKAAYPSGANNGAYCDPALDTLVAKANATEDAAARTKLWGQVAQEENANPSQMWMYTANFIFGINAKLKNFQPVTNTNWYEPWTWYVS